MLINCGDDLYFVAAQKRQNQKQSCSLFIQNLGHQEYVYIIEYDPNFFKLTSFSRKSIKLSELFLKDKRLRLNSDRFCYECEVGSGGRGMGGGAQIYRIIEGSCSLGYCWNSRFHLQRRCLWVRWRGRHVGHV